MNKIEYRHGTMNTALEKRCCDMSDCKKLAYHWIELNGAVFDEKYYCHKCFTKYILPNIKKDSLYKPVDSIPYNSESY